MVRPPDLLVVGSECEVLLVAVVSVDDMRLLFMLVWDNALGNLFVMVLFDAVLEEVGESEDRSREITTFVIQSRGTIRLRDFRVDELTCRLEVVSVGGMYPNCKDAPVRRTLTRFHHLTTKPL
jgi:hypothetical protein